MAREKTVTVIELQIKGDYKTVKKSGAEIESSLQKIEKELTDINKLIEQKKLEKQSLSNAKKTKQEAEALKTVRKELTNLQKEQKRLEVNQKNNEQAAKAYRNAAVNAQKEVTKETRGSISALKEQSDSVTALTRKVLAAAAAWSIAKNSITFAVDSFKEFEYTMMNVQTLLDQQDRTLKSGSIQLMKEYGFSIQDVNKALYDAISTAIPARNAIDFLNEAARLAVGGVTDLSTAVDGLTSIINAYGLETSEAGRIADAFFRAQKWAKATVSELVDDIGRMAPVAAIAGVSYQEMLGAISELTLGGLDARESVTVLRQAIAGLIKPAAGAEEALRKYNVPVGIAEVSNVGLAYSLGKIMEAYQEFPDIVSEMIPNIRAFTGVTALTVDRLKNMEMITNDINENWGEFSSLSVAVARQMTTQEMKTRKYRGELAALGEQIGKKFKAPLEWMMENFRALIGIFGAITASVTTFVLTSTVIPNIMRAIAASFVAASAAGASFATVLAAVTGGLSLIAGVAAAFLLSAGTNTDRYIKNWRNATEQIDSTKQSFSLFIDELKKLNELISSMDRTDDKYLETLEKRSTLIDQINAQFGEYIDGIITEKTSLAELLEIQNQANEAIETNIALRMKQQGVKELEQTWADKAEKQYTRIEDALYTDNFSNQSSVLDFEFFMDQILKEYRGLVEKALKEGTALPDQDSYRKGILKLAIDLGFDADDVNDIEKPVEDLLKLSYNFANGVALMNSGLHQYQDNLDRMRQRPIDTMREMTPEQLLTNPAIGYQTGVKKMTYQEFKQAIADLPEEYDEWKESLMNEFLTMYDEFVALVRDGKNEVGKAFAEMTPEEREADATLKERELALIRAYTDAQLALTDEQKALIDSYNFYAKELLTFDEPLSAEHQKDLGFLILKWNSDVRKKTLEHNRMMIQMQLEKMEDEVNLYEKGYSKELMILDIQYAKRMAQLELSYEKEKEATRAFVEDMQIEMTPLRNAFRDMDKAVDIMFTEKMLQTQKDYQYQRKQISDKILQDMIDFRLKYIDNEDQLLQLERDLNNTLVSMMTQFNALDVSPVLKNAVLSGAGLSIEDIKKLVDELVKNFDVNGKPYADVKAFTEQMTMLFDMLSDFQRESSYRIQTTKFGVLESLGITTLGEEQLMSEIALDEKLIDVRKGLIEVEIKSTIEHWKSLGVKDAELQMTKEIIKEIENEIDVRLELAREVAKLNRDQAALQYREPTGNVTQGEKYDIRKRELELQFTLGKITKEDFDAAIKELNQDIPAWMRDMTDNALEDFMTLSNGMLAIATDTINEIFRMRSEESARQFEREMQYVNDRHQAELDVLKDRLDKGVLTEERYQKEKEKIDLKYQRRQEEIKKRQFKKDQDRAVVQAVILGAVAAIKAYLDGGWLNVGLVALETAAQIALIESQKYKKGGKVGLIGGDSHSMGGTKFFGEDGSVFEAEKDEMMFIINKQDSKMIRALNSINSIHGKSFAGGGAPVDGGKFQRDVLNYMDKSFNVNEFVRALEAMPAPVVSVEEVVKKSNRLTKIKNAAK